MVFNHLLTGMILEVPSPKTNIAPDNRPSQDKINLPTTNFQGLQGGPLPVVSRVITPFIGVK